MEENPRVKTEGLSWDESLEAVELLVERLRTQTSPDKEFVDPLALADELLTLKVLTEKMLLANELTIIRIATEDAEASL